MDNIVASKLYRKGSVAYVSKSGGMSNELNNIISNNTDGVYEGVAIGGDRYPGTTFIDHMLRFQQDPECKILVLLGEVGGVEEYKVIDAVKQGVITKPIVAWAIGTCASMFKTEVQFGHAGSFANSQLETAAMKNKTMKDAGIHVPETFEDMPQVVKSVYDKLVSEKTIIPAPEPVVPKIPMDYSWAQSLVLSESLLPSSPPFLMTVARNCYTLVCPSPMYSGRTLVSAVSCRFCGSDGVFPTMPPSSWRWFSCSLLITVLLCLVP